MSMACVTTHKLKTVTTTSQVSSKLAKLIEHVKNNLGFIRFNILVGILLSNSYSCVPLRKLD